MSHYWEFRLLVLAFIAVTLWVTGEIVVAWYKRWKQWRHVKPHYGSVYDATVKGDLARPNVDLRRTR